MIDERRLYELGQPGTDPNPRPFPEIAARAALLRRRRRTLQLGAVTVAAGLGIAVLAPIVASARNDVRVSVPAVERNLAKDCTSGRTAKISYRAAAGLLYMPPSALTGPLQSGLARQDTPECGRPTAGGTWYSTDARGLVTRSFTVSGPTSTDYYAQANGPEMMSGKKSAVDVDGQPGTLYYSAPARLGRLFWETPDGSSWQAEGTGMTRDQVIAAARSIVIHDAQVDERSIPTGLDHAITEPARATGREPGMWVLFQYGSSELQISAAGATNPAAPVGSSMVDINGMTGWLTREGQDHVRILWAPAAGLIANLDGQLTPARALAVARATVKVSPDDPRLR